MNRTERLAEIVRRRPQGSLTPIEAELILGLLREARVTLMRHGPAYRDDLCRCGRFDCADRALLADLAPLEER